MLFYQGQRNLTGWPYTAIKRTWLPEAYGTAVTSKTRKHPYTGGARPCFFTCFQQYTSRQTIQAVHTSSAAFGRCSSKLRALKRQTYAQEQRRTHLKGISVCLIVPSTASMRLSAGMLVQTGRKRTLQGIAAKRSATATAPQRMPVFLCVNVCLCMFV